MSDIKMTDNDILKQVWLFSYSSYLNSEERKVLTGWSYSIGTETKEVGVLRRQEAIQEAMKFADIALGEYCRRQSELEETSGR